LILCQLILGRDKYIKEKGSTIVEPFSFIYLSRPKIS